MPIVSISYKRKFSLDNYENEDIGVSFQLESTDDPEAALNQCRNFVTLHRTKANGYVNPNPRVIAK